MGSLAQKIKMLNTDYVRGIPDYINSKKNLMVEKPYLMHNSANPLNHTACYRASAKESEVSKPEKNIVPFVCPITNSPLQDCGSYLYSNNAKRAYPIIEGIPVLDAEYSLVLSTLED